MSAIVERLPTPDQRLRQRIARPQTARPATAHPQPAHPATARAATARPQESAPDRAPGLLARLPWRLRAELDLPPAEPELASVLTRLRLR